MARYFNETNRGRTLHVIELDRKVNGRNAYLDATEIVNSAIREDRNMGYQGIGPFAAIEIERAKQYAEYVEIYYGTELHDFNYKSYNFFTEITE